ncbi:MAG: bifunctional DNA-formamidopyrimidine glycosylase/DNA-(apurinic or apyrimidinic site) lyase [Porticoccaceae bacterium]|nr:bifunctional DNA-formamidopyrimidine glycosylase/DNA-(apurinic or apyrimidinic site) lyase [Pseudomonadales bacterium]MCP5172856.1 bifunctional DNA-formamidopyrimidine glycosylase/DNA-(apurinic or apyrimidinic site) lyase [Pseudomonadales bacterium]MCP5302330.1 bifunctional DNA-formamidopyrimidine glycosylase/DNA-(apurinic or apyrimidinic site) lyase [Pseudomonadales bacterium]
MPELPEVETTLRGISPYLAGKVVHDVRIREFRLRWPIPRNLPDLLLNQKILKLSRRGKYLLFQFRSGHLLMHLGMSGSLRIVGAEEVPGKHDHLDIGVDDGCLLRFSDPRRFGSALWLDGDPYQHPLLKNLGPEPLAGNFCGDYLFRRSRGRTAPVKSFLMDSRVVVGVGNIYANEALFLSGIRPDRAAGKISRLRYQQLASDVIRVLGKAIEQGGTTLKDFVGGDGKPGYFKQQLNVYGRGGEPCVSCKKALREIRLGQRSTVFCRYCQR